MAKFKVGDTIKRKNGGVGFLPLGGVVTRITDKFVYLDGAGSGWYHHRFELEVAALTPIEQATKLLIEAGYTIDGNGVFTPPKPKLTGTIAVYKSINDRAVRAVEKGYWDKTTSLNGHTLLAILPWTEGQGLDRPTEGDGLPLTT